MNASEWMLLNWYWSMGRLWGWFDITNKFGLTCCNLTLETKTVQVPFSPVPGEQRTVRLVPGELVKQLKFLIWTNIFLPGLLAYSKWVPIYQRKRDSEGGKTTDILREGANRSAVTRVKCVKGQAVVRNDLTMFLAGISFVWKRETLCWIMRVEQWGMIDRDVE